MTCRRRDGNGTPLGDWFREQADMSSSPDREALFITDIDWVMYQYIVREDATGLLLQRTNMLLIEAKTYSSPLSNTQREVLTAIDWLARCGHKQMVPCLRGGEKRLFYHGLYLLTLSGERPDDGGEMTWAERGCPAKPITASQLSDICAFRLDAHTLTPREERNHHNQRQMRLPVETWPDMNGTKLDERSV